MTPPKRPNVPDPAYEPPPIEWGRHLWIYFIMILTGMFILTDDRAYNAAVLVIFYLETRTWVKS